MEACAGRGRCKIENGAWGAGYDKWNDEVVVQTE